MKSMDELLSRFNDIQDLPVTEEMIGAYSEGNLNEPDFLHVADVASVCEDVSSIIDEASSYGYEENMSFESMAESLLSKDYGYLNQELAHEEVSSLGENLPDIALPHDSFPSLYGADICIDSDINNDIPNHVVENNLGLTDSFISDDDSFGINGDINADLDNI